MEKQIAEDSRVISENLCIIISQVTRELTDQQEAIDQVQKVLASAQTHGWQGFACVVDKDGTVVAHPNPDIRGATVSLETYRPTATTPGLALPQAVLELPNSGPLPPGIYKSSSDIIAVQWLPGLMTCLCVHQPQGDIRKRAGQLLDILTRIGLVFVVISASGTWIFVGRLVERYESNLAVSEERNRTLVQNSDAIVVIDDTGMILHTNPSAESLFGVTKESARMRPVSDFWQSAALSAPTGADSPAERESEIRTGDGRTIGVSVRSCRIDFLGNNATYLLFRDTTESRRAREEITEANRRLKELDRLKSDFLNTVSHELRTPLTSIKWSTESLSALSNNWDEETFSKLLRIIRDDNQRLTKLVEQLLSFSKLDAGQLAPKFKTVAIDELIEKAALEMEPIAASKDIEISIIGSSREPIHADREQVRLLLTNLLDNAIKYSPSHAQVTVALEQGETDSIISISDSGIGIKKDDIDNIFDRFYRADRAEVRDETGTGLGLAIVKGILEAHAGSISVESVIGEGSTFRVRLPINRTESESS